jgi:LytS/YehU family sensor histidine kinase
LTATTTSVGATLAVGVVAASISSQLGFDPWPWILAAIGGGIMRVKMAPTTKLDGAANGMISIVLGGGIAPWAHDMAFDGQKTTIPVYVIAFVIAMIWPWLKDLGKKYLEKKANERS